MVKIKSYASVGIDPSLMGIGPIDAIKLSLQKAGWKLQDIDLIELKNGFYRI